MDSGYVRRGVFAAIAVAALVAFAVAPVPEGLSRQGMTAAGILCFNIMLWMGNVMPKPAVGLLVMILLPLLGVTESISETARDFMSTVFFILLAAFAISTMIEKTSLPHRLMKLFFRLFGTSTRKIILAFMLSTAITSGFMSDFAACALFASIAYSVSSNEQLSGKLDPRFMKCLMIGIPIAALAGGTMTPIGCPANVVVLGLMRSTAGIDVTFLQWMGVGIPISLLATVLAWLAIVLTHKPSPISESNMKAISLEFEEREKPSAQDKKALITLIVLFALWIVGGWFPALDPAIVAMGGVVFMLLPGVGFFDWKEYQSNVSWDLVIMVGCLMALAAPLLSTGVVDWLVATVMADATTWNPFVVLFVAMAVVVVLRAFIPSGSPVVVIATPAFVTLAITTGISPATIVFAMSIWSQITMLVPTLDAMFLITYAEGRYTVWDVLKFGLPLTVILLLIDTFALPLLVHAVGL